MGCLRDGGYDVVVLNRNVPAGKVSITGDAIGELKNMAFQGEQGAYWEEQLGVPGVGLLYVVVTAAAALMGSAMAGLFG